MSTTPLNEPLGPSHQQPGRQAGARLKFGRMDAAVESVQVAIARARDLLFSRQHPEGYWCGELEA
ncbi:MAG TPA: hypothetical protein VGD62_05980, partial [Acidobacteriaceae bacterium]